LLLQEARSKRGVIVVIDEAQNLDASVLESVRLLSDFETPRMKLLQIILSGQPELANKLASPQLIQFRQRVSLLSRLAPFAIEETSKYIQHRLSVAGYSGPSLFSEEAMLAIARVTEGIPRSINNFCFNLLSLACAQRQRLVDLNAVEEVIKDLDIRQHVSDVPLAPLDRTAFHLDSSENFPEQGDTPYVAGGEPGHTLTPAEARAYMRQLVVQSRGWKRN
jgi:general secretion pathway protein A